MTAPSPAKLNAPRINPDEELALVHIYEKYHELLYPTGKEPLKNPHKLKKLWIKLTDEVNLNMRFDYSVDQLRERIKSRVVSS